MSESTSHQDDKKHIFDNPNNVRRVIRLLVVICIGLFAVDFVYLEHRADVGVVEGCCCFGLALKALDQAYATEWQEGDADGVMALFTEDATIVPHHGDAPIKGQQAIRNFWFNPDYPPTVVPEWNREPAEVFVEGDIGVVRGRSRLVWEYDGMRTTIPEGNYVIIAERKVGG